jgi:ribosomal protein S18 acetylase RimI-like enzyme
MIIKLTRKNILGMAVVDKESGHKSMKAKSLTEIQNDIKKRFAKEEFYGFYNGEMQGYVGFKHYFPGYKHCELHWVAVRKGHQREGVGMKLVKYAESYAKKKGFRKIFAYTNMTNTVGRKFYQKLGYKKINVFPDYYGYATGSKTAILYGKKL